MIKISDTIWTNLQKVLSMYIFVYGNISLFPGEKIIYIYIYIYYFIKFQVLKNNKIN
jgi:hypothetical protein